MKGKMTPEITKAIRDYRAAVRDSNRARKQEITANAAWESARSRSSEAYSKVYALREKMVEIIGQR